MVWGRKKQEKPVLSVTESEIRKALSKKFADAVRGVYCRTLAFSDPSTPEDDVQWLEAHRIGRAHWVVVKRTKADPLYGGSVMRGGNDQPIVRQDIVKGCEQLSFMDAMAKLAEYESGQEYIGLQPAAVATRESLGFDHFVSFAAREGLVFDTEGQPHPTADGRVVTKGVFTPESLEVVSKTIEKARLETQEQTAALLGNALAATGVCSGASAAFGDYLFAHRMQGGLKAVREIMEMGIAGGFFTRKTPEGEWKFSDGSTYNGTLRELLENRKLYELREMVNAYYADKGEDGEKLRSVAHQALEITAFLSTLTILRRTMNDLSPRGYPSGDNVRESMIYSLLEEAEHRLERIGGGEGDVKALRALLMAAPDQKIEIPEGIDALISRFENICTALRESRAPQEHLAKTPPRLSPPG